MKLVLQTYVVTQEGRVFQTTFDRKVRAFACGEYAWRDGENRKVFVYVTYQGGVQIYPVIELDKGQIHILVEYLKKKICGNKDYYFK